MMLTTTAKGVARVAQVVKTTALRRRFVGARVENLSGAFFRAFPGFLSVPDGPRRITAVIDRAHETKQVPLSLAAIFFSSEDVTIRSTVGMVVTPELEQLTNPFPTRTSPTSKDLETIARVTFRSSACKWPALVRSPRRGKGNELFRQTSSTASSVGVRAAPTSSWVRNIFTSG